MENIYKTQIMFDRTSTSTDFIIYFGYGYVTEPLLDVRRVK